MASKRKRVVLSLADKLKIVEQSDKGVSCKQLAAMYGVGQATISDIKKSKPKLLNYVSVLENEDGSSSRKSMKSATNIELEDAIFKWFLQQRSVGNQISGPILCEKAKILAQKLGGSSFKASHGWLRNFKFRHGVRELSCEKVSVDSGKFKTVAESYYPEFLYNAGETGLVCKSLSKTTLVSRREYSAPVIESVREESVEDENDTNVEIETDTEPSASEAFAGFEIALKWMKRQPECDHMQLLTVKRMRDLAARKRIEAVKQLTLTEIKQ